MAEIASAECGVVMKKLITVLFLFGCYEKDSVQMESCKNMCSPSVVAIFQPATSGNGGHGMCICQQTCTEKNNGR